MRISFGEFELDDGCRQLFRNGEPVPLSAKQFLLLQLLLDRRPNAVSKRELYDRLWPKTFVSDANLPRLIADIREVLGDDARTPRFIRNVHGFGYAFCADAPAALRAEPRAIASLSGSAWHIALPEGETLIGRDPSLPATIDHASVSRCHAAIVCTNATTTIRDLGSKNGTFVGGIRIAGVRELVDGDRIALGSVRLVFHSAALQSTITAQPANET